MTEHSSRRWAVTTGAAAVLAAGLGLSGYVVARAASGSTGKAPAATAASTSKAGASHGTGSGSRRWAGGGAGGWPGKGRPGGMSGMGGVAGFGALGTIDHVGSTGFTVTTQRGTSLTIDTTKSTLYYEAQAKVSASALHAGENVVVQFKPPATTASGASLGTSKLTAIRVEIVLPSLGGNVLSDAGGTIVVADQQGFHRTIVTSGSTRYVEAGATVAASAVHTGTDVVAVGTIAADHTDLDATVVEVVGPSVTGKVTKISGSTITIAPLGGGGAVTVTTGSSTIFRSKGAASAFKALKRGDLLLAIGTPTGSTGFAASAVQFGSLPSMPPGMGRGGWGGGPFAGGPGALRNGTAQDPA